MPKTLKILDEIDVKTKKIFKELPVDTILSPIIMHVMQDFLPDENETVRQTYHRVKEQNLALYERIANALEKTKQYIHTALKKLEDEKSE